MIVLKKFKLDINGDEMSDIALNSIYGVGKYADDTEAEFGDASADFNNCMKIRINEDVTFRDTALDKPATVLLAHDDNTYDIQVNGEAEARTYARPIDSQSFTIRCTICNHTTTH